MEAMARSPTPASSDSRCEIFKFNVTVCSSSASQPQEGSRCTRWPQGSPHRFSRRARPRRSKWEPLSGLCVSIDRRLVFFSSGPFALTQRVQTLERGSGVVLHNVSVKLAYSRNGLGLHRGLYF